MKKCIKKITVIMLIFLICISSISIPSVKAQGVTSHKVSSASGEKGNPQAGDQNGDEYVVTDWYFGNWKKMYRYQGDNAGQVTALIAEYAVQAAENPHIGYNMSDNRGFWTQLQKPEVNYIPSNITEDCNTDCTGSTSAIVRAVGHTLNIEELTTFFNDVGSLTTSKNTSRISYQWAGVPAGTSTHGFMVYSEEKYLKDTKELQIGDILVSDGHAVIYVGDATATSAGTAGSNVTGGWEVQDTTVDFDKEDFRYNGRPRDATYEGKKSLGWIILSGLGGFLDYLVGFLFKLVSAVFVGYVELIQNGISNVLVKLEQGDNSSDEAKEKIQYTIEDLVYNRIPALDVNIFSKQAGGKDIQDGSPIQKTRELVSAWYVTLRNISLLVVFIAIIVAGIRMAIATTPSKKANYKEFLMRWVKALVLLFVVHYIIYFVLALNSSIVNIFEKAVDDTGENVIYNIIKTRAYDVRISVGFPGTIMYLALFIYWLRFLWLYTKRYIKVLVLIVTAPIIIAKYAISSSKKSEFDHWLGDFVSNVILQSVHALEYGIFFGIAVNLAKESVTGFIIALIFMSEILKLDDIVLDMISFRGSSSRGIRALKDEKKFRDVVEDVATVAAVPAAAAITVGGVAKGVGTQVYHAGKWAATKYDDHTQKVDGTRHLEQKSKERKQKVNNVKNKFDTFMLAHRKQFDKNGNEKLWVETTKLRMNARKDGKIGKISRAKLNAYKKGQRKIFKAKAGTIGKFAAGTAEAMFAIPFMANNWEEAGIPMLFDSASNLRGGFSDVNDERKNNSLSKNDQKLKDTVVRVNEVNDLVDQTEAEINGITDKEKAKKARKEIETFEKLRGNNKYIEDSMKQLLYGNQTIRTEVQSGNYNKLVSETLKKVDKDSTLNEVEKTLLENRMKDILNDKFGTNNNQHTTVTFTDQDITDISNSFSDAVKEETVSNENMFIADNINKIKNINQESQEKGEGSIIKTNMFTKELDKKVKELNNI